MRKDDQDFLDLLIKLVEKPKNLLNEKLAGELGFSLGKLIIALSP